MRHASIFARACLLFMVPSLALAQPAPPPACQGRDLLAEMKSAEPNAFASIRAVADAIPNTRSILWRIEKDGSPASFLFGTIHSTDERVHKFSPAMASALEGATTVALELAEIASGSATEAMGKVKDIEKVMVYQGGNGLIDHLSNTELETLRAALSTVGFPPNLAHLVRPWLAYASLAVPICELRRAAAGLASVDKRIGEDALKRGKRLVGLERTEDQVGALSGMPEAVQVFLLRTSLALYGDQVNLWEMLHQLYLARDLGAAMPFATLLLQRAGFDTSLAARFENDLIDARNIKMRDAALPLLQSGNAFIAVGALHLPGKTGLVELFRAAGYTVTAME